MVQNRDFDWRKNIASVESALATGRQAAILKTGAPAGGFILLTDGSFIFQHHNRVLLPPP
jgi:hypothetical protein